MTTIVEVPRESDELLEGKVFVDGIHTTIGVSFMLTIRPGRPSPTSTGWVDAVVRDGKTLYRNPRTRGDRQVWARCVRGDETAVIFCGVLSVS